MRRTGGGEDSDWRVALDVAPDLHRALFMREALRISSLAAAGHLILSPPDLRAAAGATGSELTIGWDRWWANLLDRRRAGSPAMLRAVFTGATGGGTAAREAGMSRLAQALEAAFQEWWGRYPPTDRSGLKARLVRYLRAGPEGDLVRRRDRRVSLTVDVLAVDGEFRHATSNAAVVVSLASRADAGYLEWLERVMGGRS